MRHRVVRIYYVEILSVLFERKAVSEALRFREHFKTIYNLQYL